MPRVARASLVAFALVVCAWFALGARQARDTLRATTIVNRSTSLSATEVVRARSLIRSAGTLNPDLTVGILRAVLAIDENDDGRAEGILLGVVHDEPMNLDAWVQLAEVASQDGDTRTFSRSIRTIRDLEPPIK